MKKRADVLAVEQGLAPTRAKAQALIMAGALMRGPDRVVAKAGELLDAATELWLRSEPMPYVSRGGLKLAAALAQFGVQTAGRVCIDIGASTGGFTDCLLQHGATRVFAVDVGYGQLDYKLRQDARVVVLERVNIRNLERSAIAGVPTLAVIDVSFISLKLVLPEALRFLGPEADLVALVKPQFEVGRADVGKGGIVRDVAARERALREIVATAGELGLSGVRTMDSPILGAEGNHEYLMTAHRSGAPS